MKVPLEPIPTEQIVLAKEKPPRTTTHAQATMAMLPGGESGDPGLTRDTGQMDKAYPWLLGVSTCLSALLCWMYVTKPVIIQKSSKRSAEVVVAESTPDEQQPRQAMTAASLAPEPDAELVPSDTRLPASKERTSAVATETDVATVSSPVKPRAASDQGPGWERTNLKVQHILSADDGTGELEKIVLNVPVIYETRNMLWSPAQVSEARSILSRLMMYERNLSNLRKEGTSIMEDWNQLIKNTVPASALRADSPSLPYNHAQKEVQPLGSSGPSLIQVENR